MTIVKYALMLCFSFAGFQTLHATDPATDRAAVERVLAEYKGAIERLDASATTKLFTADSEVYENGGVEGNFPHYLAHHLGPELAAFKSFKFSNYKISVRFEGPLAFTTETYDYRIEPKTGEAVERKGLATSMLRPVDGEWKIVMTHSSARRPKAK